MITQTIGGLAPLGNYFQPAANLALYGLEGPLGGTALGSSPGTLAANSTGNIVTLTGIGTSWTPGTPGTPTFTLVSTGTGASITSQHVISTTSATITVSAGTVGTITVTDPSTGDTTQIAVLAAAGAAIFGGGLMVGHPSTLLN